MDGARRHLAWLGLILAIAIPLLAAAQSPLLAWRDPIYILAGFAGIAAFALLLLQPLLAAGWLPGLSARAARVLHRWTGASLVLLVIAHVVGLWITSPPDMIDALLFASPTPFSPFGVVAMWALFLTALLALARRRLRLRPRTWRLGHTGLAAIIVLGSAGHALLVDGTMETVSKIGLAGLVVGATAWVILRAFRPR